MRSKRSAVIRFAIGIAMALQADAAIAAKWVSTPPARRTQPASVGRDYRLQSAENAFNPAAANVNHPERQASLENQPTHEYQTVPQTFNRQVPWWHNASVHGGLDGSKQPQDFGVNAHFGGRIGGNVGVSLLDDAGLGAQLGLAYNFSDNAVKVFEVIGEERERNQLFLTFGLFQRTDGGVVWGAVYDVLWSDYYSSTSLGQFRGLLGYQLDECNEVGLWGTLRGHTDDATVATIPVQLNSIDMINAYWAHRWKWGAQTTVWMGVTSGHGEEVLILPPQTEIDNSFVFGAAVNIPLNDSWALSGQANFLSPADSGTVDAYLGFTYFFGGTQINAQTGRFRPVLPVANNSYFPVDLSR